tara:strand:- start:1146 stop:2003 length:858 start_codon:yes stop_codon:yes gene_type:complete
MANTTFTGAVRSENGFTDITKSATTGAVTTNSTYSNNASVGGTLDVTGVATLPNNTLNGISMFNEAIGTTQLGLNPTWNLNFGGPTKDGLIATASTLNLLTPPTQMLKLSLALEAAANQTAVVSAAQSSVVFGGTGVVGIDQALAAVALPTVTLRTVRLTGGITSNIAFTAGADMTTAGDQCLFLFSGDNTMANTNTLTLTLNAANELDAESTEAFITTAAGKNHLEKEGAATDGNQTIILTATGATTILPGSFIYLHAGNNTDVMSAKICIRTSAGVVAVTYGS